MKNSSTSNLSKEQLQDLKDEVKRYFAKELETELGDLQTEFLIDFIDKSIGKHFYNQGVTDTINSLKEKTADLVFLIKE